MDLRSILRRLDKLERDIAELRNRTGNLPVRWGSGGRGGSSITRMKLKAAADPSGGAALCNTWDGTTLGTEDIPVKVCSHRAIGEIIYASQVSGGTGATYTGNDVTWAELPTNVVFPVRLATAGGVSGTNGSAVCTYTYTVKDITNSITLGTPISLTGNGNGWRGLMVALTAATYGLAYLDSAGAVVLIWVDEKPGGQNCA